MPGERSLVVRFVAVRGRAKAVADVADMQQVRISKVPRPTRAGDADVDLRTPSGRLLPY
jgi:hypothetical protein